MEGEGEKDEWMEYLYILRVSQHYLKKKKKITHTIQKKNRKSCKTAFFDFFSCFVLLDDDDMEFLVWNFQ